jgi:predicted heme/steroid binding protein
MSATFTHAELANYNGETTDAPIYVAIKGTVFDVSTKKELYGPKGSYHCFAGKDASKVLTTTVASTINLFVLFCLSVCAP